MNEKEFIKTVSELGFSVEYRDDNMLVLNEDGYTIARVSKDQSYTMSTEYLYFQNYEDSEKEALLNSMCELAKADKSGCEYCDKDTVYNIYYPLHISKIPSTNGEVEIRSDGEMRIWSKNESGVWLAPQSSKIKYCPMCGKKLI